MPYTPEWLSQGAEVLVERVAENRRSGKPVDYDALVVGSGYGGAVAAARLSALAENGAPLRVCVLERGREYVPGTFPHDFSNLPGHVRFTRYYNAEISGQRDGLYDLRTGGDVSVLLGSGLGGGSLINAAVAEPPEPEVFADEAWPSVLRDDPGLDDYFALAAETLEVGRAPRDVAKHRALRALAQAQNLRMRETQVAIHTTDAAPNQHGVNQKACIKCGDCVTGCNFWAKNTLAMNYLPSARRNGAELYTNATVARVRKAEPVDGKPVWEVVFRLTVEPHPPLDPRECVVRAHHVVLSAGTFGSTEILMRSREGEGRLEVSPLLGRHVSTNGDMISVLYGQRDTVNAAPEESTPFAQRNVGPTITGIADNGKSGTERVVVEELSIPGPLRRLFEETVTTAALAVRLGIRDKTEHRAGGIEPEAVDPAKVERSQVFAAMGDDGARGRLAMGRGWTRADADGAYGALHLRWPKAGSVALYDTQDKLLETSENALGGLYLRSPLWMPVRTLLSRMLSGSKPEGKLLSVHPLGGCPMGESVAGGVVDHMGRVFDPAGGVHEGLLVLDGSIVPRALGINPLLTITALAERAVALYATEVKSWHAHGRAPAPLPAVPDIEEPVAAAKVRTAVRFAERMTGDLALGFLRRPTKTALEVEFSEIDDIPQFLRLGAHRVPIAGGSLRLEDGTPARVSGDVFWMERARTGPIGRIARGLFTWVWTRLFSDLAEQFRDPKQQRPLQLLRDYGGVFALASNVGEIRYLRYALTLEEPLTLGSRVVLPQGTRIEGLKTLQYSIGGNPWRQLSELTVSVQGAWPRKVGVLEIDLQHFLNRFTSQLQVTRQADQPSALIDQASIALFIARLVLKIHFWSFRAPSYEPYNPDRQRQRLPGPLPGLNFEQRTFRSDIVDRDALSPVLEDPQTVDLTVSRYWLGSAPVKGPVLLIHGFGSGAIQYAHPGLRYNLARHLAWRGYDVWVGDLRTSIANPESRKEWTLDDVAIQDVTALVTYVSRETQAPRIDVVAHCIGSAMFCTAALAQDLSQQLRRVVLLQVGPLVTLSKGNDFRGRLAAAARRYLGAKHVDSSVNSRGNAKWSEVFFDRLLNTYPYKIPETLAHRLIPWKHDTHTANCNRSAAIFGRLFDHHNLDAATLDALADLLGHTNLRTFEQTVRYAFDKRITDYQGFNEYVTEANVRSRFGFPVRFIHGAVNDVFHPDTTARSLEMLQRVHGPDHPAERVVVPGYGHLDPLVGKHAHRDVYPRISEFLDRPALPAPGPGVPAREQYAKPPIIGPIVGWTRRDGDKWIARVWCRPDDEQEYPGSVIAVVLRNGEVVPGHVFRMPVGLLGRIEKLAVIDVDLPDAPGNYVVVVVGAYDAPRLPASPADDAKLTLTAPPGAPVVLATPPVDREVIDDDYGRQIVAQRGMEPHRSRLISAATARLVKDPGYFDTPDSAYLPRTLFDRLDAGRDEITFAVASCRYAPTLFDRERADAAFGRLRDLIDEDEAAAPSLLLLTGDQVYVDATAGLADAKTRRERCYDVYREAWTAPNARAVLARLPVYMMMDDHEAGDDWHPMDTKDVKMRDWGKKAFTDYQLSHSPKVRTLDRFLGDRLDFPCDYAFDAAGFHFYVCDTRSARSRTQIMSEAQFLALREWLIARNDSDRPKFVVTPSVLVPFVEATQGKDDLERRAYALRSDGWDRYPESIRKLFSIIAEHGVRNVVFLSGDSHLSNASRIEVTDKGGRRTAAVSIVASPLYAPYPFSNLTRAEIRKAASVPLDDGAEMRYCVDPESWCERDSFTLVNVKPAPGGGWTVAVTMHGIEGPAARSVFTLPG